MGIGPVPATQKLMQRTGRRIAGIDVVELNEAFASQILAVLRQLGLPDDGDHVNPHGGAIALGHPLGMSGARLALTAVNALETFGAKRPSPPCASASGRASPSSSNGSDRTRWPPTAAFSSSAAPGPARAGRRSLSPKRTAARVSRSDGTGP